LEQVVSFLFKYNAALFSKSQFGFGARPPVLIIIALAALIAALLYFLYATPKLALPSRWRAALIAIRLALLAVILLCIMRPVIVVPSVLPQSSYVAVLMDDSSSMKLAGDGSGSRLDAVKQLMSDGSKFYGALADKFKLREFKFTASPERINDANELTGEGEQTNLAGAIDQSSREVAGLPLSGVILLSDGASNSNVNDDGDSAASLAVTLGGLRARGVPIYTIGVGQTRLEDDVELSRASAPRRVLAGSMATAELLLRAGTRRTVKIELSEDNHLLRSQEVAVQGDATTVARVSFTPSSPGLHRYKFTAVPSPEEPVQDNNSQELLIDVEDSRPKILYIEGEPRWEYGKLRDAVAEEKNVVLVSVLRSADGKFYRQGVENADELAGGFPKSEEDLFKYDAVMLGSVEATFFTFDQLKALEQFVSRRGGALLALGGAKSFNAGGYGNTPLADLLPVYLNGASTVGEIEDFKAAPADRGRDHPAVRLAEQPETNVKAWEQMPAITLPEVITDTKPGATVILEARSTRDKNRVAPLLVEERYGRGRTLVLLASDTWRWRMMLESKNTLFETFWRNLLRYLVDGVRRQVEASAERSFYGTGDAVRLRAEVADEKFISINDAQATARVTTPSGRVVDVALKQTVEGGFEGYAAPFRPDEDGLYRVEVTAKRAGSKQGTAAALAPGRASFLVGPINREAWNAAQNRELLERVASETGGKYYPIDQADKLIDDITHREGAGAIRETKDLWDMPVNFLLVLVLASGEWFIRKRKGLA
jgi:uncharacterized membrane protein